MRCTKEFYILHDDRVLTDKDVSHKINNGKEHKNLLVHGFTHVQVCPGCVKKTNRFGEYVVVDQSRVYRKQSHQEDDVTTGKNHIKHLKKKLICILAPFNTCI